MNIDSIIFDLDGTLWNTVEVVCKSWNTVLAKYPMITKVLEPKDVKGCMGLTLTEISKKLFSELDESFQIKLMKECIEIEQVYLKRYGGTLYPNLEETLNTLSKRYRLFIVSNCQDGYIQCFLNKYDLNRYFSDFECWGVTGLPKGENNRIIIERNNLKRPIYVGDTSKDAESAKAVNIPFVYARYGFGNVEEYDYAIDRFEEMLELEI